jgi:hypothetical protein
MVIGASYYVSPAFYAALPRPHDRTVNVVGDDESFHGVITFGGYANAENILSNRRQLLAAYPEIDESQIHLSLFQLWSFDPWWKFWNRRNEIHLFGRDGTDGNTVIYGSD